MKIAVTIAVALACLTPRAALAHPHHGCQAAARRLYAHVPPDLPPTPPVDHSADWPAGSDGAAIQARSDARDKAIYAIRMAHYNPNATRDMLIATCADRPKNPGREITITIDKTTTITNLP